VNPVGHVVEHLDERAQAVAVAATSMLRPACNSGRDACNQ
jgi:hypothetical protein